MINGKSLIAVIPARGGGKRLPGKNLINLGGKPLIAWTIEAALGCSFIDEVMVTTDDAEIAEVSKRYGANVPFMRPVELSGDTATTFDAIKHTIDFYRTEFLKEFDYIVLLQPTSPLRDSVDITEAIELLEKKNADAIISVCEVDHSPLWMNTLPLDGSMVGFIHDEVKNKRSQDLDVFYRLNGAIYICNIEALLDKGSFFIDNLINSYLMPIEKSVDIDSYLDLEMAKVILQNLYVKGLGNCNKNR
jgi:CMP-N-acetylneuraminic acid synthetase